MWSKLWSEDLLKIILLRRQVRGGDGNATRSTGSHSQAGEVKSWKIAENCQNVMHIIFPLAKFQQENSVQIPRESCSFGETSNRSDARD